MEKNKKKYILIFILIFILLLFVFRNNDENNIRIRVIANSNSEYDLMIKTEVYNLLKSNISPNSTQEEVEKKIPEIKEMLEKYSYSKDVTIDVSFGKTKFPPKQLDGVLISGGEYLTLLVTIGEGKGNNYWTLLYPEYFGITFEEIYSGEVEIRFFIIELFK